MTSPLVTSDTSSVALEPGGTQYLLSLAQMALVASVEIPERWGGPGLTSQLLQCLLRCPQYEVREVALGGVLRRLQEEEEEQRAQWLDKTTLSHLTSLALQETHPQCLAKVGPHKHTHTHKHYRKCICLGVFERLYVCLVVLWMCVCRGGGVYLTLPVLSLSPRPTPSHILASGSGHAERWDRPAGCVFPCCCRRVCVFSLFGGFVCVCVFGFAFFARRCLTARPLKFKESALLSGASLRQGHADPAGLLP